MSNRTHLLFYSPKNRNMLSPLDVPDRIADDFFSSSTTMKLDRSMLIKRGDTIFMAIKDNVLRKGSKAMIYARGFATCDLIHHMDFYELDVQIDYIADPIKAPLPLISEMDFLGRHNLMKKPTDITLDEEEADSLNGLFDGWVGSNRDLFTLRRNRYTGWTLYDESDSRSFQITMIEKDFGIGDVISVHTMVDHHDNEIELVMSAFRGDPETVFSQSFYDNTSFLRVSLLDATDFMEAYDLETMKDLVKYLFDEFGDLSEEELMSKLEDDGYEYDVLDPFDGEDEEQWDDEYPDDQDVGGGTMGFPPFSPKGKRPQN